MALMFRSVLQNAGGAAELIVTCDSEFAGATISCSDGTTTLNKTCPSSSPYEVTFKIPNSGDWTISATVSGTAYTSDPISVELDYTALLEYGLNWRRWVDTAKFLDSSDYNSLDEVLADEEAVRELCLEHACVDYLAEVTSATADVETIIENDLFAKWANNSDYSLDILGANTVIKALMDTADKYFYGEWVITDDTTTPLTWGAKGNVPVMTSDSAPYGTASASSEYNANNAAWKAFNGDLSNWWSCTQDQTNPNITYKFTNPTAVKRVRHWQNESGGCSCKIRWSDDGVNFTDVADSQYTTIVNGWVTKDISNVGYHLYWNVYFNNLVNHFSSSNIQFYGRELSVSVPVMTSNTTPYGEVVYTSQHSTYLAWKGFDGDDSTQNSSSGDASSSSPWGVGYKFTSPIIVKRASFIPRKDKATRTKIQASNDGATWSDLSDWIEDTDTSGTSHLYTVDLENTEPYIYYRLLGYVVTSGSWGMNYYTIQFYGLDYSEKEFEAGTTKKWLYDHGVELEEIVNGKDDGWTLASPYTFGEDIVKNSSDITITNTGTNKLTLAATHNAIDMTPYGTFNVIASAPYLYTATCAYGLYSAKNTSNNLALTYLLTGNMRSVLDISAITQSCYAELGAANGTRDGVIKELWLE